MTVAYLYKKYKDVHTIQNTEATSVIQYTITRIDCHSTTPIGVFNILPGKIASLKFALQGEYEILVEATSNTEATPTTFKIMYFNDLLQSFIQSTNTILCGCNPCGEVGSSTEQYLAACTKAFSFLNVNFPVYNSYLNIIVQDFSCVFTDELNCSLLQEKVFGKTSTMKTLSQIIAFHYLAFYYKDLALALDVKEKVYISEKYKFSVISKCMRSMGIDPKEIIESIEEGSTT